tara:strand:+ start:508 stop:996 length:489 start_codon:yes stop_codon:yes gene_type:complete
MSHSVQKFRVHIKKRIETTSSNRSYLQEKLDNHLELFDKYDNDTIAETLEEHGSNISDIHYNISNLKKKIHKLKQEEKFLRYAHNLHLENCEKYHKRIANLDLEKIEDMTEQDSITIAILDEFGKPLRYEENSHAYQNACKRIKEFNEEREKVINYVKQLIS